MNKIFYKDIENIAKVRVKLLLDDESLELINDILSKISLKLCKFFKGKRILTRQIVEKAVKELYIDNIKEVVIRNIEDYKSKNKFPIFEKSVENILHKCGKKFDKEAVLALGVVLDYTVSEIIDLANYSAIDKKRKVITPVDVKLVIDNDPELLDLYKKVYSKSPKKSPKKTIAQKIKECKEQGLVYDRETGKCRQSKRGKKSPSKKSPKKTIAQKIKECKEQGLVYDRETGKCRQSKRGKKSPPKKSPKKKCPDGTVLSPVSGRCIKIGGAAYKKHFG